MFLIKYWTSAKKSASVKTMFSWCVFEMPKLLINFLTCNWNISMLNHVAVQAPDSSQWWSLSPHFCSTMWRTSPFCTAIKAPRAVLPGRQCLSRGWVLTFCGASAQNSLKACRDSLRLTTGILSLTPTFYLTLWQYNSTLKPDIR